MAANAWDSATPTNANTIKTTVPDEFQALKTVNLQRKRFWGNGIGGVAGYNFGASGGGFVSTEALQFNSTLLTAGAYVPGTGEYTVDKTGTYQVEASCGRLGSSLAAYYEGIKLQKYVGGAWSDFAVGYVPGSTYVNANALITARAKGLVALTAGDKIRAVHHIFNNTNLGAGLYAAYTDPLAYMMDIEFIRTP